VWQNRAVPPRSNDAGGLAPLAPSDRPTLAYDLPALEVGVAEYAEGPTGCTVFHFPRGAACAVDVRGGSVGVLGESYGGCDAICLAGGSLYGLEAATGVSAELLARRGYEAGWGKIGVVAGAVIYDLGGRDNTIYPDKELGRAALRAARTGSFPLGPCGAGRSATVGKLFNPQLHADAAGQGGAFRQLGPDKLAVFTVVNAVGAVVDRAGRTVRGYRDPATGQRRQLADLLEGGPPAAAPPPGNTTLTVVVANRKLDQRSLRQLGRQVHASMARAIQPFHALSDGDVLFAASTGEVENPDLGPDKLAAIASELAWDAVLASF
jgi:L-aminopeptidase/D-esterase-like protein